MASFDRGQGGMATVYLAQDLKHHRQVAVKVLRPDLAASLGADRFLREIEVAARLQHPHILPLHDSGEADGFLYYVMPYVDGESLRGRLSQGELPIPDAVRILSEVADALAYAPRPRGRSPRYQARQRDAVGPPRARGAPHGAADALEVSAELFARAEDEIAEVEGHGDVEAAAARGPHVLPQELDR
jgi:aminoglycoside phosphotransferase (APT) family kinase protein